MYKSLFSGLLLAAFTATACGNHPSDNGRDAAQAGQEAVQVPEFDARNAYNYIARQVANGPRVPNSESQLKTADYLQRTLKTFVDTVYRQETTLQAHDGKKLRCINLIGGINPKATSRILLLSHWDSRPWADQDTKDRDKPIDGADDGASGVGVLLELAAVIKQHPLPENVGVDILFTDVEDYGKSEWGDDSYALGTQYWARHPHVSGYTAIAGILLDMVGGRGARFPVEAVSEHFAQTVRQGVWASAQDAGAENYFVNDNGGAITDDHVPVNQILGIPTIDIINLPAGSKTGFPAYWHTHNDNMNNIDQATLKAVGQTLLQYIYNF